MCPRGGLRSNRPSRLTGCGRDCSSRWRARPVTFDIDDRTKLGKPRAMRTHAPGQELTPVSFRCADTAQRVDSGDFHFGNSGVGQ